MVHKDSDCGRGTKKVMAPGVQCSHDHEQFLVVDVIIVFCRAKRLREIGIRCQSPLVSFYKRMPSEVFLELSVEMAKGAERSRS